MIRTIKFKSSSEMYMKELSGLKPNTIRENDGGERFDILNDFMDKKIEELDIVIERAVKTDQTFRRRITDVTLWKGWYVISWNPNKD